MVLETHPEEPTCPTKAPRMAIHEAPMNLGRIALLGTEHRLG
jgi:hypothetical protein